MTAWICGVGETAADLPPGSRPVELAAEAAMAALADAGLDKSAVDGLLVESPDAEPHHMFSTLLSEYMGLDLRLSAALQMGGATPHAAAILGSAALAAGQCQTLLVVDADNRRTRLQGEKTKALKALPGHQDPYEDPYEPTVPAKFALMARRYMAETGCTREHLAAVAVAARAHASLHPNAQAGRALTRDDVLNSAPLAEPLHRYDCCLVTDWGSALVLTASSQVSDRNRTIPILGLGQAHHAYHVAQAPSLSGFPCIAAASHAALAQAGIPPADLDLALLYDPFTVALLIALEECGLCPRGEAGPRFAAGEFSLGGRLPVNPHGGQLAYSGGHGHYLVEAVRQLRGEAGMRQVKGARRALSLGTAASLMSACALVLGSPGEGPQ